METWSGRMRDKSNGNGLNKKHSWHITHPEDSDGSQGKLHHIHKMLLISDLTEDRKGREESALLSLRSLAKRVLN